jgi:ABC-type polar amino acid transport system ATPase subunit
MSFSDIGSVVVTAFIAEPMQLLAQVSLAEKRDSYPAHLSGGQQQRVAIVRSLMMQPNII